jgi:hypothetical protein
MVLPAKLLVGPRFLIPILELALLVFLGVLNPDRRAAEELHVRTIAITIIALISLANLISVALLIRGIVGGSSALTGRALLYGALSVWVTNILVFGLWFWETDRGGPRRRSSGEETYPDFQFPQMTAQGLAGPTWKPSIVDYLYVALTNATAFSPTDTMPLTWLAKLLMTIESLVSMATVIMVAARAVNII